MEYSSTVDIGRFGVLSKSKTELEWTENIKRICREIGYEDFIVSLTRKRDEGPRDAYVRCSCSPEWCNLYEANHLELIDPSVSHCKENSLPLLWSPEIFSGRSSKFIYDEAAAYGLRSGVVLPIHGPDSLQGRLFVASSRQPGSEEYQAMLRNLGELTFLRDVVSDTVRRFLPHAHGSAERPKLTTRESEVLSWLVAGETSIEIAKRLHCSRSNVEFHIKNLRRKFQANSRRQVVVRAIAAGLAEPA
jgi:LuxR family quorum-sensing transcriptional regulator LasR